MTYNFETNIELRMPDTGKVYAIQRMTSEWAERNAFDVDGFVGDVAQRHGADIERVRTFFNYGLGRRGERFSTHCPAKHRDKIVKDPKTGIGQWEFGKFPDYVNGCEPALIEAWNKGAEYHTKGFRMGDVLPSRVPMCKITRVGDGWIALFPTDMHLLEGVAAALATDEGPVIASDGHQATETPSPCQASDTERTGTSVPSADAETAHVEPVPPVSPAAAEVEPSSIDPRDEEIAALRARIAELEAQAPLVIESVGHQAAETTSPCQASDTERTGTSVPSADAGTARMEPVPPVSPAAAEVEPSPVIDGIGNQSIDIVVVSPRPTERERNAAARQRRREQREAQRHSYEARLAQEAAEAEAYARQQERRKIFAAIGAAAVTLALIYFFGLLGPAVFGLLAGGLLKG